ncbi:MAG: hypothetical protein U9M89_02990 [Patescibacteria group bacterium]|nr:hypothetical protein [Patescibacteria group bacterium]
MIDIILLGLLVIFVIGCSIKDCVDSIRAKDGSWPGPVFMLVAILVIVIGSIVDPAGLIKGFWMAGRASM